MKDAPKPKWAIRMDEAMRARGMSIPDLAQELGEDRSGAVTERLAKYRSGQVRQPRGKILQDIARILEIRASEFRHDGVIIEDWSENGDAAPDGSDLIREIDVRAGFGSGEDAGATMIRNGKHPDAMKSEVWRFPQSFVRNELRANPGRLLVVETTSDNMTPTISPGERVFVDTSHVRPSPDGIYAIRDTFGGIQVKRLQIMRRDPPVIRIISDNAAHPAVDVAPDEIEIVGRVICGLKRY